MVGRSQHASLDLLWRAYVRRFDLEHTLRFLKQSLGWTTPRVRHPEQADRGTWLVVAVSTQLRRARPWVVDRRLPWERPRDSGTLTPTRVRMMPPRGPYRTGRTVREWRRDMRTWFAFVVALLLVLSAPGFVLAQDTSPVAEEGMPEGVAFEILAQRLVEEFPTGPAEIGFARLTLPPARASISTRSPRWSWLPSSPGPLPSPSRPQSK